MTIIEAIISGIVQGITEFLPISSSGHLVLLHKLFGWTASSVYFDLCLHAGTLAAVIIYFWRDITAIWRKNNTAMLGYLALGSLPAGVAAFLFKGRISGFFGN